MIPARIVETQDEKTKAFVESVEATFDGFEVSFYTAGNTESQALVTALAAVQSYTVNAAAPKPAADRWAKPAKPADDEPPMLGTVYKGPSQEA